MTRPRAGLALSVGNASLGIRLFLSLMAAIIAIVCAVAGRTVTRSGAAGWALAVLIEPFAIVCAIAAAFIVAPHSRFAVWLDEFVPRLRRPPVALATIGVAVLLSLAMAAIG